MIVMSHSTKLFHMEVLRSLLGANFTLVFSSFLGVSVIASKSLAKLQLSYDYDKVLLFIGLKPDLNVI